VKTIELQKLGFQKSGSMIEIKPTAHKVKVGFELEPGLSTDPHVYVWVDVTDTNDIVVLYCGRAEKGIKTRMSEHSQGFKGLKKGTESRKKKHDFLSEKFVKKRKIEVWSKSSNNLEDEGKYLKEFSEKVNYWLYLDIML
jgi:hypothetical protein